MSTNLGCVNEPRNANLGMRDSGLTNRSRRPHLYANELRATVALRRRAQDTELLLRQEP